MKIALVVIAIVILIAVYIFVWTPYPFVWMLRSKKEASREKGPENIKEIKERITIQKGLSYPSKYPKATYDLYLPKKEVKHVVVWVHGGSFIAGTSEGFRNFGPMLADHGVLSCAINYALAPEHAFPTQLFQLDEFLSYLANEILISHHLSFDRIILGGDSAGANLVSSYATMMKKEGLAQNIQLSIHHPFDIEGLLLFCGPYDFCEDMNNEKLKDFKKFFNYIGWSYLGKKSWYQRKEKIIASPLQQISDQFPPAYIVDGKQFSFMWQGKKLVEELKRHHVYVKERFYDHMGHGFEFDFVKNKEEARQVFEDTLEFLQALEHREARKGNSDK